MEHQINMDDVFRLRSSLRNTTVTVSDLLCARWASEEFGVSESCWLVSEARLSGSRDHTPAFEFSQAIEIIEPDLTSAIASAGFQVGGGWPLDCLASADVTGRLVETSTGPFTLAMVDLQSVVIRGDDILPSARERSPSAWQRWIARWRGILSRE